MRQESGYEKKKFSSNESIEKNRVEITSHEKLRELCCSMASFSHEINNPLSFVISNMETLAVYLSEYREIIRRIDCIKRHRNSENEKSIFINMRYFGEIADNDNLDFIYNDIENLLVETMEGLERIKEIVSSIKAFARYVRDEKFRIIDLNMCVDKALLLSRNEIKNVARVEKEYMNPLIMEGDCIQLVHALLNLLLNAAYAIKSKQLDEPGLIRVHTYADEDYAYCEVADNGIGIPKENLKQLFDAYFTTKPLGCGTGLGLSIARDIISGKHKGEIIVESEQGVGSIFTVKLPLRQGNIDG